MKFIKKYSLAIIIVLFLLLCFKTCSSNSTKRILNDNIERLNDSCRSLNDKIKSDSIKFTNIINEMDGTIIRQQQQIDIQDNTIKSSQRDKDNLYFILKENQKNNNKEK